MVINTNKTYNYLSINNLRFWFCFLFVLLTKQKINLSHIFIEVKKKVYTKLLILNN